MSTRRKTHSQHTKQLVFGKAKPSGEKDIRLDRASRMIKKQAHGIKEDPMGWNIHHVDGDWGNNSIINLEAVNYATHKKIHDED